MARRYGDELLVETVVRRMYGCLFHMTDEAHLDSIAEHGLLSAASAQQLGVSPARPGGNALTRSLDTDRGLDGMVFLSFYNLGLMPRHEDARFRRPVLLSIDPAVLYRPGVKVALGRANRRSTVIHGVARAFYEMDWDMILGDADENAPGQKARGLQVRDYEILVPGSVPAELIIGKVTDTAPTAAPR